MEVDLVHTNVILTFHYANTVFNNTPPPLHSPFSQSGSFFVPLVSQSSSTHCHRPVLLSQSHTGIFTRLHSPFIITIPSIRRQHQSQYCFHSSSLWKCRNQSRSKLPLLSSPTKVLERNIYSLLSQYPVSVKCQNSTALIDLISSSRPPDLIALQETKISTSSTDANISYSKPPLLPAQLLSNNSLLQVSRNFWWRLCLPGP